MEYEQDLDFQVENPDSLFPSSNSGFTLYEDTTVSISRFPLYESQLTSIPSIANPVSQLYHQDSTNFEQYSHHIRATSPLPKDALTTIDSNPSIRIDAMEVEKSQPLSFTKADDQKWLPSSSIFLLFLIHHYPFAP